MKLELYGDRRLRSNPFHWEKVIFNLPGSKGYRADLPWVFKLRWDGKLGVEVLWAGNRAHGVPHLAGGTMVRCRMQQKRGSGCIAEADVTHRVSRTLGRDSHVH